MWSVPGLTLTALYGLCHLNPYVDLNLPDTVMKLTPIHLKTYPRTKNWYVADSGLEVGGDNWSIKTGAENELWWALLFCKPQDREKCCPSPESLVAHEILPGWRVLIPPVSSAKCCSHYQSSLHPRYSGSLPLPSFLESPFFIHLTFWKNKWFL